MKKRKYSGNAIRSRQRKVNTRKAVMKRPGSPVTMACYGEGSGNQATWNFNNKISRGVRKRDKGWKRNREKDSAPLADFQILIPLPDLAVI